MHSAPLLYSTGEEVHAGDRVLLSGAYATVVFFTDGQLEEIPPGYEDYTGSTRGLIVCDDDGVTCTVGDSDKGLALFDRG